MLRILTRATCPRSEPARLGQPPRLSEAFTLVIGIVMTVLMYGCGGQASNFANTPPPLATVPEPAHQGGHVTLASWYGPGFVGHTTSNGERFNDHAMTAASKSLPLGTHVRVTNISNGKSVVVRINDRGPYVKGRGIDLSRGAAERIGLKNKGVGAVKITRLDGPSGETGASMPGEVEEAPTRTRRSRRLRYARYRRWRRTPTVHYASTGGYTSPSTPASVREADMVPNPIGSWLTGMFH